ncbi:uncharacterized protein LOC129580341 [Sitodiplosis mosellana]|uniref:uncharacterized protein LOC129580341 n=1 Tax=Sitodiplosis mosellana TaxID=263140 RepID=UPI0024446B7A|nr:uncharacterized protein LOC129580341 [Sitodiplosis mosellana]
MRCFKIIAIISVIQIKIGMNILFIYLYIQPLIMESGATMPANSFIDALINPFVNLFAYVGLPVQKRELYPFSDQEIPANVQEVSNFEPETPAKVVEIVDPNANLNYKPWFNPIEHIECGPEIPIVLVDKGKQIVIMRSFRMTSLNDFQWERYKKVSEMRIPSDYGYDRTLEQLLVEVSQRKEPNAPLRFRPVPIIVQGGHDATNAKPVTNQQINNVTQSQVNPNTCNPCEGESIKTRPNFPVYASKLYDLRRLSTIGLLNASSFKIN